MADTGFVTKAARFFGRMPNQSLQEFASEMKGLTEQDKAELDAGLGEVSKEGAATGSLTY